MYQLHTRAGNIVALKMLNICGFSFFKAMPGDKCAHLGHIAHSLRKNIYLPPMDN